MFLGGSVFHWSGISQDGVVQIEVLRQVTDDSLCSVIRWSCGGATIGFIPRYGGILACVLTPHIDSCLPLCGM